MAGMVVDDIVRAQTWYATVLGRPADSAPMPGLLEWHFTGDAWLQVVELAKVREIQHRPDWGCAGGSSVAFVVSSLDRQRAIFVANGIAIVSEYTTEASLKTATVSDPSGNFVTFVEESR